MGLKALVICSIGVLTFESVLFPTAEFVCKCRDKDEANKKPELFSFRNISGRGVKGDQGPAGVKGAKGDIGPPGTIGPVGPAGPNGTLGANGPKGAIGDSGKIGLTGPIGPLGTPGAKGTKGEPISETKMNGFMQEMRKFSIKLNQKLSNLSERIKKIETACKEIAQRKPKTCPNPALNRIQVLKSNKSIYCHNGWRVIQRRFNGEVYFHNRTWNEYKNGFGSLSTEFWTGLNEVHLITQGGGCRLRVEIGDWSGDAAWAHYRTFRVGNESDLFRIRFSGYTGSAKDSMDPCAGTPASNVNNQPFTTVDRDNDQFSKNCASFNGGGWWYSTDCGYSWLNGRWGRNHRGNGMTWFRWKDKLGDLKSSMMMVRCD